MKHFNLASVIKTSVTAALMLLGSWGYALDLKPFNAKELSVQQQQGKPVVVHFHADWCSTCVAQSKSLESMKSDPQLRGLTVLVADYDKEKELRKSMKVRSQSVMVVYKGSQEVARIAGQSQAHEMKAAFIKAL
jgi:thioredoxin 1